jgi:hypothetical protein
MFFTERGKGGLFASYDGLTPLPENRQYWRVDIAASFCEVRTTMSGTRER